MEKLFARCYTICEHKIRCCVCSVPRKKLVLNFFEEQAGSNCHLQYFTPHVCNCSDSIAKPFQAITIFTRPLSSSFKHLDHSTNCVFFCIFHVESCLVITETPCKIISSWNSHFHSPLPDLDSNLPTLCTCVVFCFSCFLSLPKWFIILQTCN